MTAREPRTFVIEFPPGTWFLSANDHLYHYAAHKERARLRELAAELARRVCKIPPLGRAVFRLEYQLPTKETKRHPFASRSIRDHENLAPTAKAFVDGMVDAGVLAADSRAYVPQAPLCHISDMRHPLGRMLLHITEVLDDSDRLTGQ